MDLFALIDPLGAACREAGEAILAVRRRGFDIERKDDRSPVTEADRAAEAILLSALKRVAPHIPVVAEEEVAAGRVPEADAAFFLVDPLDGTKEFVRGGSDYTVNIGLVIDGVPVLGIILAPEQQRTWIGIVGQAAWVEDGAGRRAIEVQGVKGEMRVVASKSHMNRVTEEFLTAVAPGARRLSVGSSLKFCLLAEGKADLYPRMSPTSEWDTAAGHAILVAAGGQVRDESGAELRYGKPGFLNPGFIATGALADLPSPRPTRPSRPI